MAYGGIFDLTWRGCQHCGSEARRLGRLTDCCGIEAEAENESGQKKVIIQSEFGSHKSARGEAKTQEDNLDDGKEDGNADESITGVLIEVGLRVLRRCRSHIAGVSYT